MVDGLLFGTLHTNILVYNSRFEVALNSRSRDQRDGRGVDVVVKSFWDFQVDTVVGPWIDIVVAIKNWIWIQMSPLIIISALSSCQTLPLKTIQLSVLCTCFFNQSEHLREFTQSTYLLPSVLRTEASQEV